MNNKTNGIHVGGTSIIMVFTLLFFAMFGSLSLSTAHVDLRQSEKARDHIKDYYAADAEAVKIINRLTYEEVAAAGSITRAAEIGAAKRQELTVTVRAESERLVIDEYRVRNIGSAGGTIKIDDDFHYYTGEDDWG